jgi:hypothetical protein
MHQNHSQGLSLQCGLEIPRWWVFAVSEEGRILRTWRDSLTSTGKMSANHKPREIVLHRNLSATTG